MTWKPARQKGYRFDCWYTDEECTVKYVNGAEGVQENLKLYGRYEEVDVEFDETVYYVTGSGQGDLYLGGNFTTIWKEKFTLTRLPDLDEDGLTVYETCEITMYKGDQFKIVSDLTWANGTHFGFHEMRDPGDVFCNEAGIGNIGINRGMQGTYKFKFHTDPFDYTNNYIEWELVAEVEEKVTENMYIVGNLKASGNNNWSVVPANMIHMSVGEDGVTWSVTILVDIKDEFKIYNSINKSYHPGGTSNNMNLKLYGFTESGYYTISWNADTDQVSVEAAEAPETTPDEA
ncbi:MAG: InlB B-repeat-containing protein [Clostridia bacterium]|nr:InlB B-repeat-containing protein [Clostridia bacterium]